MPEITPLESSAPVSVTPPTTQPSERIVQVNTQATPPPQEAPKAETPATDAVKEAVEAVQESPENSSRIAALIRREKQILKRARELAEKERLINQVQSNYAPWKEAAELAKQNKLEALKKLGISYEDLTQQILNGGQVPPQTIAENTAQDIVKRELEAFEQRQQRIQAQTQQRQYQNTIREIDAEVQQVVDASDKYPLVKNGNAYHDVTRFIESEFHRSGRILPVVEALERWENELADGLYELANVDKIRQRFQSPREETPAIKEESPIRKEPVQKITTLTHKSTQSATVPKPASEAERRQRAIEAFYGRTTN